MRLPLYSTKCSVLPALSAESTGKSDDKWVPGAWLDLDLSGAALQRPRRSTGMFSHLVANVAAFLESKCRFERLSQHGRASSLAERPTKVGVSAASRAGFRPWRLGTHIVSWQSLGTHPVRDDGSPAWPNTRQMAALPLLAPRYIPVAALFDSTVMQKVDATRLCSFSRRPSYRLMNRHCASVFNEPVITVHSEPENQARPSWTPIRAFFQLSTATIRRKSESPGSVIFSVLLCASGAHWVACVARCRVCRNFWSKIA